MTCESEAEVIVNVNVLESIVPLRLKSKVCPLPVVP